MAHKKYTNEEMQARVVRFKDVKKRPIPLMFIDSVIPGHQRINYAIIGDTASENPDFSPMFTQPHRFQIGMVCAPSKSGPAWHTHDYIEMFMPLTGKWKFNWGSNEDGTIDGSVVIGPWDMISLPPGAWRSFENISKEDSWLFAVLEQHEVFIGKDPYWGTQVIQQAAELGFNADERGKMIKPSNFKEVEKQLHDKLVLKKKTTPAKKTAKKKTAKKK